MYCYNVVLDRKYCAWYGVLNKCIANPISIQKLMQEVDTRTKAGDPLVHNWSLENQVVSLYKYHGLGGVLCDLMKLVCEIEDLEDKWFWSAKKTVCLQKCMDVLELLDMYCTVYMQRIKDCFSFVDLEKLQAERKRLGDQHAMFFDAPRVFYEVPCADSEFLLDVQKKEALVRGQIAALQKRVHVVAERNSVALVPLAQRYQEYEPTPLKVYRGNRLQEWWSVHQKKFLNTR